MSKEPAVLLIAGPAGAGKSTAADAWARTRPYPCAHISLDQVRSMVKAGYADPQDGWAPEQKRQCDLARGSAALLARRFVGAGFSCVIDDAIFPEWAEADYPAWLSELEGVPHRLIVLMPGLDVVIDRDGGREGSRLSRTGMLQTIYEMMTPWRECDGVPVIDNSSLSVAETVDAIQAAIGENAT